MTSDDFGAELGDTFQVMFKSFSGRSLDPFLKLFFEQFSICFRSVLGPIFMLKPGPKHFHFLDSIWETLCDPLGGFLARFELSWDT